MFKYIKFFFQKTQSAKYIRKGKCNKCGACCRNIVFYAGDDAIKTEKQFESLKQWDKHYGNFRISGRETDGTLLFTCNALNENNKCKLYFLRGLACRMYPNPNAKFLADGGQVQEGCGYYFEPDKKFSSFLK